MVQYHRSQSQLDIHIYLVAVQLLEIHTFNGYREHRYEYHP